MRDTYATLQQWILDARRLVFFGGAGVSTESGIPDFRSADGLYHQHYRYPPETIISHSFFIKHPAEFFAFYREKMVAPQAKPNAAHLALAALERCGICAAVVTQNIDGLHQEAGSQNVLELHGSVHRNFCMRCHQPHPLSAVLAAHEIPLCACGGIIKPDVVLYEESLSTEVLNRSIDAIAHADVLIIGGTSLSVYPAASLIHYYQGDKLVLMNRDKTDADAQANLVIRDPIAEVFSALTL